MREVFKDKVIDIEHKDFNRFIEGISCLRIFATVCVVWLHTCSTLTDNKEMFFLTDMQYSFFCAAYQIMYWAVPAFFMITGALILNKKITYQECLSKYIRRSIIVLFLFGIPYAILKIIMKSKSISIGIIYYSLKAVIEGDSFGHLWYLYVLIGIYLVIPVLQLALVRMQDKDLKILLSGLLIVDFILPTISAITGLRIAFTLPFTYPMFYIIVGYYINNQKNKEKNNIKVVYIVFMTAIIIFINYLKFYPKELTSYFSPLIAIFAMCIFDLFKQIKIKNNCDLIWKIDRLCFGVYLIHPLFIQFTYKFLKITPVMFELYYVMVILFFIVFVLSSFIGAWILSKVKILKQYVL